MVVLITGGWIFASITQILRLFLSRNKWRQIQIWYQSNNAPDVKALKEDWNLISYWFGGPKRPKTYTLKYIWIDLNIITVNFSLLKACCLSQYSRIYQSFLTFTIIEWPVWNPCFVHARCTPGNIVACTKTTIYVSETVRF